MAFINQKNQPPQRLQFRMSPSYVPTEYLKSPLDGGRGSIKNSPVFRYAINIDTLFSFTLKYPPPPEGYDDSKSAGGRTYFLQPLALRRVINPHIPRFRTLSWMETSRSSRRQGYQTLFICSHLQPRSYTFPPYLQNGRLVKYMGFKHGLPPAHHVVLSPLAGEPTPPCALKRLQTRSELFSQASPKPPKEEDDCDINFEVGPESQPEPEHDQGDLPYDWARQYRRENPRLHRRWSAYAVTPSINRQSAVFQDKSRKQEDRDFEDYLRIGTRTNAQIAADRTSSKHNTCQNIPTACSLGLVKNPLAVRFTDAEPKPNNIDDCYPHDDLVASVRMLIFYIEDSMAFLVDEVVNTPTTLFYDEMSDEEDDEEGHKHGGNEDKNDGTGSDCRVGTAVYTLLGVCLKVYIFLMLLYIVLVMSWIDLGTLQYAMKACSNRCQEVFYSAKAGLRVCNYAARLDNDTTKGTVGFFYHRTLSGWLINDSA